MHPPEAIHRPPRGIEQQHVGRPRQPEDDARGRRVQPDRLGPQRHDRVARRPSRRHREHPDPLIPKQIDNLRYRIHLIRNMQAAGVSSLLVCVLCMFVLFFGEVALGKALFAGSLFLMIVSLALSVREIQVSVKALDLHLLDLEERP